MLRYVYGRRDTLRQGHRKGLKAQHYKRIQELAGQFREKHGTIICRELLKGLSVTSTPVPEKRTEEYYKVRPCAVFVRTAAEVLDRYIAENPPVR